MSFRSTTTTRTTKKTPPINYNHPRVINKLAQSQQNRSGERHVIKSVRFGPYGESNSAREQFYCIRFGRIRPRSSSEYPHAFGRESLAVCLVGAFAYPPHGITKSFLSVYACGSAARLPLARRGCAHNMLF